MTMTSDASRLYRVTSGAPQDQNNSASKPSVDTMATGYEPTGWTAQAPQEDQLRGYFQHVQPNNQGKANY